MSLQGKGTYRFGEFEIDPARRQVLRSGEAVSVPQKALQLLLYLLDNPGRVLTKSELMEAVWPGSFVEEGNLAQSIFLLRKALGEQPGQNLFIVTVPGEGYQFAVSPEIVNGSGGRAFDKAGDRIGARADSDGAERRPLVLIPSGGLRSYPNVSGRNALAPEELLHEVITPVAVPEKLLSSSQEEPKEEPRLFLQAVSGTAPQTLDQRTTLKRRSRIWLVATISALVVIAGCVFYWYRLRDDRVPFRTYDITRMSDGQNVQMTAISPDGNYLATVHKDLAGNQTLWVRHIPSSSDRQLLETKRFRYKRLVFSPDSSCLYFRAAAPGQDPHNAPWQDTKPDVVYRVPVIGGDANFVIQSVDSQASFTKDGQHMCFYRGDSEGKRYFFMSARLDGSDAQALITAPAPLPSVSDCSPDGKRAALTYHSDEIKLLDFASGKLSSLYRSTGSRGTVYGVNWTPDGKGLIVSTAVKGKTIAQLGYVAYPSGEYREITNNLNTYLHGASLTADGKTMATTEGREESAFYLAPASNPAQLQEAPFKWMDSFAWLTNDTFLGSGDDRVLKTAGPHSTEPAALQVRKGYPLTDPSRCGADSVVAASNPVETAGQGIFRIHLEDGNLQQLTHGARDAVPACTVDGKWLLYTDFSAEAAPKLMRLPLDGGDSQIVGPGPFFSVASNGKFVALVEYDAQNHPQLVIFSPATWKEMGRIALPLHVSRTVAFTPDNKAVWIVTNIEGNGALWYVPLDGMAAKQILALPGKQIKHIRPSPDGSQIAISAYAPVADAVVLQDRAH